MRTQLNKFIKFRTIKSTTSLLPNQPRLSTNNQKAFHSTTTHSMSSNSALAQRRTNMVNGHFNQTIARSMASRSQQNDSRQEPLVLSQTDANMRIMTLNRTSVLNALNKEMIETITSRLIEWEKSKEANLIILKSNGRAFCAGGDVVTMTEAVASGDPQKERMAASFFQQEYALNNLLAKMSTPVICFMDGITMGGGLGLCMHVPFRIATENTRVAMPETTIGLFPDVGASFFLPRMDGELGTYLGLTSTNLFGWGAYQAGFASHYVPSSSLGALQDHLSAIKPYECVGSQRQAIDHCFKQDTVEGIITQLEAVQNGRLFSGEGLEGWAKQTKETILQRSPTSCKLTLMALREGKKLDIDECFAMELRLAATCCDIKSHSDFVTGVNHLLVKKEKTRAAWNPNTLEEVNLESLKRTFFSAKAPSTTHLPSPIYLSTTIKPYKTYPHSNYSLPTEALIKDYVVGNTKESGSFALTKKEVVNVLQKKWINKIGVKEKVLEVLGRRTTERGEKEGKVLKWEY
ncbi:ClpP/crotonase-like domain-containing protein [Melampsora americana]|nr:ClpP/crotonase-like domain-containing protein [Melampsora americana]